MEHFSVVLHSSPQQSCGVFWKVLDKISPSPNPLTCLRQAGVNGEGKSAEFQQGGTKNENQMVFECVGKFFSCFFWGFNRDGL
jgi:hypothetical protein